MSLEDREKLANDIHFNSIVVDCHNDTMLKVVDPKNGLPLVDIGEKTDLHIDLDKAKKGGLDVGYFAAFTAATDTDDIGNNNILALINALYYNEDKNKDRMAIVKSVEDIKNAISLDKLAALPTIEGAYSLNEENALELLEQYKDLGVGVVAYVWNQENNLGAGTEGPEDMGLTDLGIRITNKMNELGMIIDVSHMNEKTFWDTIDHSKVPIMATHSCATGLVAHVRNLTDGQILALKENGGLVNINYWWELLGKPKASVDVKKLVDHIDYVVDLIGVDHVGLGSDFDGASMPVDIRTVEDISKITLELVNRGYSKEDIEKILGKNNLRILEEVQAMGSRDIENNIKIETKFSMGDRIDSLSELICKAKDIDSSRIIIDGLVYDTKYEGDRLSLASGLELYDGFHVVTFEVSKDEKISRETLIFRYKI